MSVSRSLRDICSLILQVAELQDEADKERRLRGKLSNEKRKLELDLQTLQDSLEEERKCVSCSVKITSSIIAYYMYRFHLRNGMPFERLFTTEGPASASRSCARRPRRRSSS